MNKETYKDREDRLFQEWREMYKKKYEEWYENKEFEDDMFCEDGLLYRGEHEIVVNELEKKKYWVRRPGNETEIWDNAKVRLLILTKDTPENSEQCDVREEAGRKNPTDGNIVTSGKYFYKNLTMWSYALIRMLSGEKRETYEDLPDWDKLREYYETDPIARVNCKKEIGESTCADNVLKNHMEDFQEFLKTQINMYDANIILCCGKDKSIKDFVNKYCISDLKEYSFSDYKEISLYFSPLTKKIIIHSYHPSMIGRSEEFLEKYYEKMMDVVEAFLKEYPEFIRTSK